MMNLNVERDVTLVVNGLLYQAKATIQSDAVVGGDLVREDGSIQDGPASTKRRKINGSFKCAKHFGPSAMGVIAMDDEGDFRAELFDESGTFTATLIEYWNGETAGSPNN
jgi:hypothetical protein